MTEKAVKKLNGLEIGANKIRVQRVTNDAPDEFGIEDEMGGAGANKKQKSRQQPSNAVRIKEVCYSIIFSWISQLTFFIGRIIPD